MTEFVDIILPEPKVFITDGDEVKVVLVPKAFLLYALLFDVVPPIVLLFFFVANICLMLDLSVGMTSLEIKGCCGLAAEVVQIIPEELVLTLFLLSEISLSDRPLSLVNLFFLA